MNAELLCGSHHILLRPKTFSVLQYLAQRPGRLVTKDELLDALWPNIQVTDGALKVCMTELRRALGDSAQQPKFVETVHRRGYRFIGKIGKDRDEGRVMADKPDHGSSDVIAASSPLVTHHPSPAPTSSERTAEIAAELAMHFERAHDQRQAITHYQQAGADAVQRHAYEEAIVQLTKALDLLDALPPTPERDAQELQLRVMLGVPQLNTKGFAAPEVERTYARALELCRRMGDTPQLFPVLEGLHSFYAIRGELPTAYRLAQQLQRLGEATQDRVQLLEAHHTLGCSEFWRGDIVAARDHFEKAIALYDPRESATAFQQSGHDPQVCCLSNLGVTLWFAGHPDAALRHTQQAVASAEALKHPDSSALAYALKAWVHLLRGEDRTAQTCAEAVSALAREHGLLYWNAQATILSGAALARQGDAATGARRLQRGLAGYAAIGVGAGRTEYLALHADICMRSGRQAEAVKALDEALKVIGRQGERYLEAEIVRLQGELLLRREPTAEARRSEGIAQPAQQSQAEQCFLRALDIARHRQARSLMLRAACCLARLWQRQDKGEQAGQLLADVYGGFTEGFETADLRYAAALLRELGR